MGPGGLNWELGLASFFALEYGISDTGTGILQFGLEKNAIGNERQLLLILELKNGIRIRIL